MSYEATEPGLVFCFILGCLCFFVLYLVVYFPMCSSFPSVLWCFWPVKGKDNPFRKPVSEMTYTVLGGTLNPTQPTNPSETVSEELGKCRRPPTKGMINCVMYVFVSTCMCVCIGRRQIAWVQYGCNVHQWFIWHYSRCCYCHTSPQLSLYCATTQLIAYSHQLIIIMTAPMNIHSTVIIMYF